METSRRHLWTIAGVLLSICMLLSMHTLPAAALEHPITSEGLVDLTGREIIPCRFDWIRADNDGLFACYEKRKPGTIGGVWTRVYNKDGKELLKSNQGILKVVILHDVPEGTVLDKLPPDTVILAFSPRGRTLLSLDGKEIIAPQKQGISVVRAGEYMIFAPKGDGIDYGAAKTVFIYDTVKGEAVGEPWRIKEVCDKWLLPEDVSGLAPDGFIAQRKISSANEQIDGKGSRTFELPEGTYKAITRGDLTLCMRHVGSGESRRAVISVVDSDGKVLCNQDNYGGGDCGNGIALLVEQGASLKEISYTVVTSEGVVAHGVKGYKLTPTQEQRLIKTVFVRYPSAGKN